MHLSIGGLRRARASKDVGSCIGWVMQHPQHIMMLDLSPHNFSLSVARTEPAAERAGVPGESGERS